MLPGFLALHVASHKHSQSGDGQMPVLATLLESGTSVVLHRKCFRTGVMLRKNQVIQHVVGTCLKAKAALIGSKSCYTDSEMSYMFKENPVT